MMNYDDLIERLILIKNLEPGCFIGERAGMHEVAEDCLEALRELTKPVDAEEKKRITNMLSHSKLHIDLIRRVNGYIERLARDSESGTKYGIKVTRELKDAKAEIERLKDDLVTESKALLAVYEQRDQLQAAIDHCWGVLSSKRFTVLAAQLDLIEDWLEPVASKPEDE